MLLRMLFSENQCVLVMSVGKSFFRKRAGQGNI